MPSTVTDTVLNVLWRGRATAPAVRQLLTEGGIPASLDIRVVTDRASAEAESDWPHVIVDGNPSPALLDGAALTTVIVPFAGINDALRSRALERPHLGVRNSHYNAQMVAQHAAALLLAVTNRVIAADAGLRRGDWGAKGDSSNLGVFLAGKRAVLLGYGNIGRALAPLLTALGMSVSGVTRSGSAPDGLPVVGVADLKQALARADVVVCSLPATPQTVGLIGAAELAALPDQAVVINVGRGPVIDETALYAALASGRLFGAGLDVWYRYPAGPDAREATLPATEAFHELANVVLSPHRADELTGWQQHAVSDVLLTLEDVRSGGRRNLVDLSSGY